MDKQLSRSKLKAMNNSLVKTQRKLTKKIWLLLSLGIVVAFCVAFVLKAKELTVPGWVVFEEKELVTGNGMGVTLSKGKVTIKDSKQDKTSTLIWTSGDDLRVQDILLSDLDSDGKEEVIALVWKKGKYGNAMPFWVSQNDTGISQHIFIYDIQNDGTTTQKWFASDIGTEIRRMKLMEKNQTILLTETVEGDNDLWKWESFGLKNIRNEVRIVAFGDNIIHREINEYANKAQKGNFDFLYEPFADEIGNADIAVIQAETILVDNESAVSGYPLFGSPLAVGEAIARAGFDVAVCGNNHALDKGIYGVDVTTNFYNENGITCIGIQNSSETAYEPYKLISRNGIRFALFSYTYGTNGIDISDKYPNAVHYLPEINNEGSIVRNSDEISTVDSSENNRRNSDSSAENDIFSDIASARNEADIIIVFVHWGEEYDTEITPDQRYYADLFASAGADVVIGTHPHVIQKMETVTRSDGNPMTIYYSLGNFRAYQGQTSDTRTGAEAILTFEHTYDGISLKNANIRELDAFIKLQ